MNDSDFVKEQIEYCRKNNIVSLDLNLSGLSSIPEEVYTLQGLKYLSLNDNRLVEIPDRILELESLEGLFIGGNLFNEFPSIISGLQKLRYFSYHENELIDFPIEILSLRHLEILGLSDNQLIEIPDQINRLINLKNLKLSNNLIVRLPETILDLEKLEVLELRDNPLIVPPIEIATSLNALDAIKNYFDGIKDDVDYLYEVKLLIVGEERAGKSSLSKALCEKNFLLNPNEKSTEGIEIKTMTIPKEEMDIAKDFHVNIWDFGGQEIYHSTHQFFLTKRSVYLFVTEARKDLRHDDFYYWLNIIELLGAKSPVIILLNKCDLPNTGLAIREYRETFKSIVDDLKVSCLPSHKDTISSLKNILKKVLSNKDLLPDIGTPLPKVWVEIRKLLNELRERGCNYIRTEAYFEICAKFNLNEKSALFLSDYFHDLGVFLHFQDDFELRNKIFLNYEWVTKAVYNVLDNKRVISRQGFFTFHDLDNIWKKIEYQDIKIELLALMKNEKFEICFELGEGQYLAPQLLPVDKPDYFDLQDFETEEHKKLQFEYHYKFMPKGILTRFIVKRHRDIFEYTHWRYGVVISFDRTKALVREKYFESPKKISVTVIGQNRKGLLAIIRNTFEEIHSSFNNLHANEMLPCICSYCRDNPDPHFYYFDRLRERLYRGKYTVECSRSYDDINVQDILNGIGASQEVNMKTVKDLVRDDEIDKAIRLFMKFAKNNLEIQNDLLLLHNRLRNLERDTLRGIMSDNQRNIEKNKIVNSILSLTGNFQGNNNFS